MTVYWVERKLEFKTVPARWQVFNSPHDNRQEAEAAAHLYVDLMMKDRANGYEPKAKGGGVIVAYRVREGQ